MSGRKNIVLDLDQTLIYSDSVVNFKYTPRFHKLVHKHINNDYITFERPHLQEFLDYIFKHFNVSVWTAASKPYAISIVNQIILVKPRKLDFVFYSDHCALSQKQKRGLKGLCILWEHFKIPGYNKHNTIIVDDNDEVYKIQKDKCYHIPPFDYNKPGIENDTELLKLKKLLGGK